MEQQAVIDAVLAQRRAHAERLSRAERVLDDLSAHLASLHGQLQRLSAEPAEKAAAEPLRHALATFYTDSRVVQVAQDTPADGELLLRVATGPSDALTLHVFEGAEGIRLIALLDNLGKGASGAAVQSLNLMAGLEETAGLRL